MEVTSLKTVIQGNSEKNLLKLHNSDQIGDCERQSNKKFPPDPGCYTPQLSPGRPQFALCSIFNPPATNNINNTLRSDLGHLLNKLHDFS